MTTAARPPVLSPPLLDLLTSLRRHGLMTTTQVHRLHFPTSSVRAARKRLARLADQGVITRVFGPMPGREARWFPTARGVELADYAGIDAYRMTADVAGSRHAAHLMAANEVGIVLADWARRTGDRFDTWGWTHEVVHRWGREGASILCTDAVVTYEIPTRAGMSAEWRFMELDRGTEPIHHLVSKVVNYRRYRLWAPNRTPAEAHLAKLDWQRRYPVWPGLVFVFDLPSDQARQRAGDLAGFCSVDPRLGDPQIPVVATTLGALRRQGPFAPIAMRIPSQETTPLFGPEKNREGK